MLTAAARPALVVCLLLASCAVSEQPEASWLGTYFGGGDGDGFVVMLDLVSGVQFASYVGGGGRDIAEGLALGPSRVWITGLTSSKNLPFPLTLQQTHGGGQFDSFLAGVPLPLRNVPQ